MVHKTTVKVIKKSSLTFLPTCLCGWSGLATTTRRFAATFDGVLSGGRIAATAQLKTHLMNPTSSRNSLPTLMKSA